MKNIGFKLWFFGVLSGLLVLVIVFIDISSPEPGRYIIIELYGVVATVTLIGLGLVLTLLSE